MYNQDTFLGGSLLCRKSSNDWFCKAEDSWARWTMCSKRRQAQGREEFLNLSQICFAQPMIVGGYDGRHWKWFVSIFRIHNTWDNWVLCFWSVGWNWTYLQGNWKTIFFLTYLINLFMLRSWVHGCMWMQVMLEVLLFALSSDILWR